MKLTRELAEAIVKVRPYDAFQTFLKAIEQDGAQTMLDLVDAPPDRVGRLQGRAKLAQDILQAVKEAAQVLEKMQRNHPLGEDGNARSTRISSQSSGAF